MLRVSRQGVVNAHREGVLSIGKLTAGQEGYYLAAVAHGAEDYYLGAGEVPGYWIGTTAGELGLEGRVSDEAFVALLSGVSPMDGLTYATVPVIVTAVAVIACVVPARRAARIDPMIALRSQ